MRLPFLALVEVGLPRRLLSALCLPRLPTVDDEVVDASRAFSRLLRVSPGLAISSSMCSSRLDEDSDPDFLRLALVLLAFPCFDGSRAKSTPAMSTALKEAKHGRRSCETPTRL
ncbi:hypothetical protein MTO96_024265 [Rhipicephalus appendiculatus]